MKEGRYNLSRLLLLVLAIAALGSVAATFWLQTGEEPGILFGQPWDTLLFGITLPILAQAYKLWRERVGSEPPINLVRIVIVIVCAVFVFASGGFAGLMIPGLPIYGGDPLPFVGALITFAADLILMVGLAFGAVEAAYQVVLRRLMESAGFATASALNKRR